MKFTFGEITCDTETAERIATWCAPPILSIVNDPIFDFDQSESIFKVKASVYFLYITWAAHHIHGEMICLLLPTEVEQWFTRRGIFSFDQKEEVVK